MSAMRGRARGFTLVELTVALVLMAGIAAVVFGSLSLAARTWDGGEAKAQEVSDMRAAQAYLRAQISAQYPQRVWKAEELPLMFAGERDEIRYAAALPERVAEGGVYYFRVTVASVDGKSQLVQERVVPEPAATGGARVRHGGALGSRRRYRRAADRLLRPGRGRGRRRRADLARSLGGPAASAAARAHRREAGQGQPVAHAAGRAATGPRGGVSGVRRESRSLREGALMGAGRAAPGRRAHRGGPGVAVARPAGTPQRMHRAPRPSSAQHGIALIVVLWLTVLLAVIASGFAYSMRSEALAARNTMSLAQARAAADGAVERTAYELLRPRNLADVWRSDGQPHVWKDGEIEITATAVDESARVDLNSANEPLLRGVLQSAGGLDPDAAQRLLEAILDWRDPDELRRPNGAEAADYRAAGFKHVPTNMRFESVGELGRVLGVTPALMVRLADSVTVYSRQRGINPATASRNVLLAVPGITPEQVDTYVAARAEALANRLPVPPLAAGGASVSGTTLAWRISVQARVPDGVTFVRDAVVSAQSNPRRPLTVLLWQEGVPRPRAEPPPPANDIAMQKNGTSKP